MSEITLTDWAEAATAELKAVYGVDLPPAKLTLNVAGAPGGDVDLTWHAENGSAAVEQGAVADADVVVTVKYKDFVELLSGELPPAAAYMQGRLKPSGDMTLILRLLALSCRPEFERWRERSLAAT